MGIRVAEESILWRYIEGNNACAHEWLNPDTIEIDWNYAVYPRHKFGLDAL
jgi:hypothetical protein